MLIITVLIAIAMPFVAAKWPEIVRWFGQNERKTGLVIPAGCKIVTFQMRELGDGCHGMLSPGNVVDLVEIREDQGSDNRIATRVTIFAVHDSTQSRWKISVILDKMQEQKLASSNDPNDIMCFLNENGWRK